MELDERLWVGLIPAFPLLLAFFYVLTRGVLRWEIPVRWVSSSVILASFSALLFTCVSVFRFFSQSSEVVLVDRLAQWIGVGVGSGALVGGLAFRFDPLSAVFSLLVSGIGFLIVLYGVVHMRSTDEAVGDYARFFGLISFEIAAMLILVLADNLLILLLGFGAVVAGVQFLVAFSYSDEDLAKSATVSGVVGLIAFGALLFSISMAFRGLAEMGRPGLDFSSLEASLPALAVATVDLPGWLGGSGLPLPEVLAFGIGLAACGLASLWPLFCWLPGSSRGRVPASALIQTVTMLAAAGYLLARFSPWLALAPHVSMGIVWLGVISACVAAVLACTRFEITSVLAWSSVSQFGLVLMAAGAGGYTESVFHVIAHSFSKGLLFMAAGVVVLAVAGEHDMRRMGNIGSRLTLTRIDLWIGAFALAGGVPLTAGFFSMQGVFESVLRVESLPGLSIIHALILLTFALTSFYILRLIYLSLYGTTRLPSAVKWEAIEDPAPRILWPMGIMAGLSIAGSVIALPQIWSDLLFSGEVQDSNSLQNFLSGVLSDGDRISREPADQWSLVGQSTLVTWLGAMSAFWLYILRPNWRVRAESVRDRLWSSGRTFGALEFPKLRVQRDRWVRRIREERPLPSMRGHSSGLPEPFLKFFQSGFLQHYLGFVAAGCFILLAYFVLMGGRAW